MRRILNKIAARERARPEMSRRSRAAAAPSGGLSPYEIARLETMRANQAQLEALGLDPLLPPRPSVTKK